MYNSFKRVCTRRKYARRLAVHPMCTTKKKLNMLRCSKSGEIRQTKIRRFKRDGDVLGDVSSSSPCAINSLL